MIVHDQQSVLDIRRSNDGSNLRQREAHDDPEQLYLSQQISTYRYKRLLKQKELEKLRKLENIETNKMKKKLDAEMKAYEELKVKIIQVNRKIKSLRKKNIKDQALAKKVERFINRDF